MLRKVAVAIQNARTNTTAKPATMVRPMVPIRPTRPPEPGASQKGDAQHGKARHDGEDYRHPGRSRDAPLKTRQTFSAQRVDTTPPQIWCATGQARLTSTEHDVAADPRAVRQVDGAGRRAEVVRHPTVDAHGHAGQVASDSARNTHRVPNRVQAAQDRLVRRDDTASFPERGSKALAERAASR